MVAVPGFLKDAGEWASKHKPIVAAVGVGTIGVLFLAGRRKSSGAQGPGSYLTPDVLAASPSGTDVLSITGGDGGGFGGGGGGSGPTVGPTTPFGLPPLSSGGSLGSPVSSHTEIPAIPTPIPALVGAGAILNRFNITNPLESITPTATYTPSASDIMSTQPGGISRVLLAVPNAPPGASYTVDTNSQLGSGPPVAVSQRIAGERYDAYGRVIL